MENSCQLVLNWNFFLFACGQLTIEISIDDTAIPWNWKYEFSAITRKSRACFHEVFHIFSKNKKFNWQKNELVTTMRTGSDWKLGGHMLQWHRFFDRFLISLLALLFGCCCSKLAIRRHKHPLMVLWSRFIAKLFWIAI